MALSREGIAKVRNGSSNVSSEANKIQSTVENLIGILSMDGNYQYFKMGTDKGLAVDADLNEAIEYLGNDGGLVSQISSISSSIEEFCRRQEELNRVEELKRQQILNGQQIKPELQKDDNVQSGLKNVDIKSKNIDMVM